MKNILTIAYLSVLTTSAFCQKDTITTSHLNDSSKMKKVKYYEREIIINGLPEDVFAFMDDIKNTGKHMTESSGAMAGSKLKIEWLSPNTTGLGANYRWTGKVIGMKMDFTVKVSKWIAGSEKVWGTVGEAKMIVIDSFEMYLTIVKAENETSKVKLSINYTKHRGVMGFLFGKWYSKWCVKSMLKDTKKHFKNNMNT